MVAREPFLVGLLLFLLNSLASDTVDEVSTESLMCKLMAQRQAISNVVHDQVPSHFTCLNAIVVQFDVNTGSRIDSITTQLQYISNYSIKLILEKMSSKAKKKPLNSWFPTELCIYESFLRKDFFLVLENAQSNNIVDHWEGLKFAFMVGPPRNHALPNIDFDTSQNLDGFTKIGYYIRFLPESIRDLKLLRHINLSFTKIRNLPESTTNMYNLQALILKICFYIEKWLTNMCNLTNLQYLDITNVNSLEKTTVGMKELKTLHMLLQFVVGNNVGSGIRDLKELNLFQQSFSINSKATTLYQVEKTDNCILWRHKISNMAWRVFIHSHGAPGFRQLSEVHNSASTWAIAITQRLVYQKLSLGLQFFRDAVLEPFLALETLEFEDMREWKDWEFPLDVSNAMFHRLCKLTITSCPKLAGKLPSYLPSLEKLVLYRYQQLVVSIPSLPMLNGLMIYGCKELTYLMEGFMQGLTEVRNLEIHVCKDLLSLGSLSFVLYLEITNGLPLISLGEEEEAKETTQLDIPFTVECLTFHLSLQKFQKAFPSLSNLRELYITKYHGHVLIRESNLPSSLKILETKDYFELQCTLDEEENVNDKIINTGLLENQARCLHACLLEGSYLQSLTISLCTTLETLSSALKHLDISICPKLKSVAKRFQKDSSLEYISIFDCANLKSLPECLYNLSNLKIFYLGSLWTFVSFPEGVCISKALVYSWLSQHHILPRRRGFRHLNSLASLIILDYPKLTSLLKDGPPPSLLVVHISQCPLLEQHCTRNKGLERFKIAQVPHVDIGHRFIIHDQERD
ncbi:hypothetical protein CXB51_003490 [Gossypium anomalum]|uniref:NB-ARC domain-containing protein n=1 Tax=Gossypium anomalum TaxID=47600 RepID=A0A8J6DDV4_9ROSI|nr:hypothetical protein CXB51_003490 [Gossypium anomalum]